MFGVGTGYGKNFRMFNLIINKRIHSISNNKLPWAMNYRGSFLCLDIDRRINVSAEYRNSKSKSPQHLSISLYPVVIYAGL